MSFWIDVLLDEIVRARQQELLDSAGVDKILAATETTGGGGTRPVPRRHGRSLSAPTITTRGTADEPCGIFGERGREGKDAA